MADDVLDFFSDMRRRMNSGFNDSESMEKTVQAVHAMFAGQFYTQGAYGGTPWAPLAESTWSRRPGKSYRILVDTGDLEASLTQPGSAHGIQHVEDGKLLIGTDLEYASYHQTGTPNMPARPLVTDAMLDQEGEKVAESLGAWILGETTLEA